MCDLIVYSTKKPRFNTSKNKYFTVSLIMWGFVSFNADLDSVQCAADHTQASGRS